MARKVFDYMIPVYAYLVKKEIRTIESLPDEYQEPVAKYLAAEIEK